MSDARPDPKSESQGIGLRGFAAPPTSGRYSGAEIVALVLTLVWLGLVALFFVLVDSGGEGGTGVLPVMMTLVGIFLPVAMIWVAAITARTAREMRAEAQRLQQTIDTMRMGWQANQAALARPFERRLEEIAASARQTETAVATFTSRRDGQASQPSADRKAALVVPRAAPGEDEPSLALGTPAEQLAAPVSVADFIRALNFPDSGEDAEGFRALRRALEERGTAKLIRAAQDVLTLLSQDGIYMDDLKPDRARPEVWRRFANGERGREVAGLGGVRDRSSLTLTAGRMRGDTIFRDAAHHFLRQFDKTFTEFEKNASDAEVAELAETRTARAFMLLGRVTGTFD
ncbi:hypothetical protein [Phaeovulum sp.]|uniref:hypothetical protein n=1 Tax=Phaeovulum sp. TaxID=2934796 RepID=UPI00272FB8D2|nr:hypothetical protein [Phaeovulum sp.]MDP1668763.1 hypothetical protein [Phaeovulum sp.]MDZ4120579.1 hypothetical protein [Phaeovulum sp.]